MNAKTADQLRLLLIMILSVTAAIAVGAAPSLLDAL
jgi:hypothetical protein